MTPDEVEMVKVLAKERHMSMSGMAAELIRQALKLPENQITHPAGANDAAYEERMRKLIQIIKQNDLL